jgi:hypothetical protein
MRLHRFLFLVAVVFAWALSPVLYARQAASQVDAPSSVSISAGDSLRLLPGQAFIFQLRFNKAPQGYGGGAIVYEFRNTQPSGRAMGSTYGGDSISGQTDLHDGQSIYTIAMPITDAMAPGVWKLIAIRLGQSDDKPVAILNNVSFEIPGPHPLLIHAQAPSRVQAGRQFTLTVDLDSFSADLGPDCALVLQVSLRGASPGAQAGAGPGSSPISEVPLIPGQQSYQIGLGIAPDAPAGAYAGVISVSARPARLTTRFCRAPSLQGNTEFSFNVDPATGLSGSGSMAVVVNPSQVDLLIGEAARLKAEADHLARQLSSRNSAADQNLLLTSLAQASADVDQTEAKFKQMAKNQTSPAVDSFFDDIRFDYGEALTAIGDGSAQDPPAADPPGASGASAPRLSRAANSVVGSLVHNAKAYEVAAAGKAITFALQIISEPQGATISYKLRGDDDYRVADRMTDCRLENLPRAIYLIKVQKPGYDDRELVFDAIYSPTTSIDVRLTRARASR